MRTTNGYVPEKDLPARRGKALSYEQWKAGYLYYESRKDGFIEGGSFVGKESDYPFPYPAKHAATYSKFLAANN